MLYRMLSKTAKFREIQFTRNQILSKVTNFKDPKSGIELQLLDLVENLLKYTSSFTNMAKKSHSFGLTLFP